MIYSVALIRHFGNNYATKLCADLLEAVLECYTDPNVPPLPPHITLTDAKNFMAMTLTEPELGGVLKNSAKQLLSSVLPGGKE
jgi:pyruvate dehydrogenase (quinone)